MLQIFVILAAVLYLATGFGLAAIVANGEQKSSRLYVASLVPAWGGILIVGHVVGLTSRLLGIKRPICAYCGQMFGLGAKGNAEVQEHITVCEKHPLAIAKRRIEWLEHQDDGYTPVMRAEIKADCYAGESCEEHRPYWWMYAEGDKDSDSTNKPLVLDVATLPVGAKVVVSVPVCPKCRCGVEVCKLTDCGFDWKTWAEERYG